MDLRNDDERDPASAPPPRRGIDVVHAPLDEVADTGFWRPFLEGERCVAAVAAVAEARPG